MKILKPMMIGGLISCTMILGGCGLFNSGSSDENTTESVELSTDYVLKDETYESTQNTHINGSDDDVEVSDDKMELKFKAQEDLTENTSLIVIEVKAKDVFELQKSKFNCKSNDKELKIVSIDGILKYKKDHSGLVYITVDSKDKVTSISYDNLNIKEI